MERLGRFRHDCNMQKPRQRERALSELTQIFQNVPSDVQSPTADTEKLIIASLWDTAYSAFGAYIEPTVPGLLQTIASDPVQCAEQQTLHKNGQEVYYLNHRFMNQTVNGVLKIHLHHAKNVERSDGLPFLTGESDPYVLFSVGSHYVRSEIVQDCANPQWEKTHYLIIPKKHVKSNIADDKLRISLLDDDQYTTTIVSIATLDVIGDDLLGVHELDLNQLMTPGKQTHTIKFQHQKGSEVTELVFSTEFVKFEDAYREVAKMSKRDGKSLEDGRIQEGTDWIPEEKWERVPLDPLVFIWVPETDTEVWICLNRDTKSLVVSFRGTELNQDSAQVHKIVTPQQLKTVKRRTPSIFTDVITDLKCDRRCIEGISVDDSILHPTASLKNAKIAVHNGFLQAYISVRESLLQIVYDITQWSPEWRVTITGHSLGGALATLCAFEFANRLTDENQRPTIKMVSYGAPRVGNKTFVKSYNNTTMESYRCVDHDDPVPTLPPKSMGYSHVCTKVHFHKGQACFKKTSLQHELSKKPSRRLLMRDSLRARSQNFILLAREFVFHQKTQKNQANESPDSVLDRNASGDSSLNQNGIIIRKRGKVEMTGTQRLVDKHSEGNYLSQIRFAGGSFLERKWPLRRS